MSLESIRYKDGKLHILDQLLLPEKMEYIAIQNSEDGWKAINSMQVRGAPAIAIVGCLSLAVEIQGTEFAHTSDLAEHIRDKLKYLVTARPTAVNMHDACMKLTELLRVKMEDDQLNIEDLKNWFVSNVAKMMEDDIAKNMSIGRLGADCILSRHGNQPIRILTHCNTGSLASAGYGTALGVIRSLHERGLLDKAFCTETRPYNQGARLTAYELVHDKIPSTLICDDMAAMLMQKMKISAVVVGADRVVSNGDTANKIGTYQLAILAKYHDVPFYVAATSTSCDWNLEEGGQINIEERPHSEMTTIKGIRIAAPGINCWNPAFDVTPASLITGGIITEYGVFSPAKLKDNLLKFKS